MTSGPAPTATSGHVAGYVALVVAGALGLTTLTYVLDGRALDMVIDVMLLVFSATAGALCWWTARRCAGKPRRGWTAMAAACWAWAASQAVWTFCTGVLGLALTYPSPVELGYLLFPVGAVVGMRWLADPPTGLSRSRRLLDALMIGCALVLVAWVTVLGAVLDNAGDNWLLAAAAFYYPLTDVALATTVVLSIARLRHDPLPWVLLGGGMLLMAATDHAFAYQLALGVRREDITFDWGWWFSFALIGGSALAPTGRRTERGESRSVGLTLLTSMAPYIPLAGAAVVAGANLVVAVEDDTVAEFLLLGVVLLVLARQYVMVRENVALDRRVQQREAELRNRAFHDALTGLPNRALFVDRLGHALDLAARAGRRVSVAFLDLDGFKAVNDTLGHAVGDALLVRVADRLGGSLRAADTLARLSGDEFAVLIEYGDAGAVGEGLVRALATPFRFDERVVGISASVGIASAEPGRGGSAAHASTLLHRADVAMYAAKVAGKGRVAVHSPALETARQDDDHALERALVEALDNGEIRAVYQPVVDPVTGRIGALEALARWTHDGVEVPPTTFVPICARAGLSEQLTALMLEQACAQLDDWSERLGHRRLRMAVNVDPTEFSDTELPDRIAALIERHRLAPAQLALEMTETAGANRPDVAMEVMQRLRGLGVRLAIDDFGTGFSTLSRLSVTPVDTVKIDRTFVADIDHDDQQRTFLAGMLELARHLGMRTVAEGVERPEQLRELRRQRCDLVQGNLLGLPGGAAEIGALVLAERPVIPPELLADPVPEQNGGRLAAGSGPR
jgi:diguanylate cyclase (GGDEF)-like protein